MTAAAERLTAGALQQPRPSIRRAGRRLLRDRRRGGDLLPGRQARLAPLYDLASAAPYGDHPERHKLAEQVGGEYRPAFIARRHWEQLAITVGVDAERLCIDITEMAVCLPDAPNDAIGTAGDAAGGPDRAQKLLDSVAAWGEVCRRAMGSASGK